MGHRPSQWHAHPLRDQRRVAQPVHGGQRPPRRAVRVAAPGLEAAIKWRADTRHESLARRLDQRRDAESRCIKDSRIGSAKALEKHLAPLPDAEKQDAQRKLLAVTGGDYPLTERLLPFYNLIRTDLRDLPVVILTDALYVTESSLRKNTGTHYTPSFLAKQVVEGALEPLVYSPRPLQTADRNEWKLKTSDEIRSPTSPWARPRSSWPPAVTWRTTS